MRRAVTGSLLLAACAWGAAEPGPGRLEDGHPAYATYRQYCASCHGIYANGQGPLAPVLRQRPPDLTRLGARYGTPLPKPMLAEFIDGRRPVRAHGPGDMPVWGKQMLLGMPEGPGKTAGQRGMVLVILDYLESVQAPPPTP